MISIYIDCRGLTTYDDFLCLHSKMLPYLGLYIKVIFITFKKADLPVGDQNNYSLKDSCHSVNIAPSQSKILYVPDPGEIIHPNPKAINMKRLFTKMYAASLDLRTEYCVFLRLDLLDDLKSLRNIIIDVCHLRHTQKSAIVLVQNKKSSVNSLPDWFYGGEKNLFVNASRRAYLLALDRNRINYSSNEQIFYSSFKLPKFNNTIAGKLLSDLTILQHFKVYHRKRYNYQSERLPLKLTLNDLFFIAPFSLNYFFLPLRLFYLIFSSQKD